MAASAITPGAVQARLNAMLAVSRAIAGRGHLHDKLDAIAAHACEVASACSTAILELTGDQRFRIAGSQGLSPEYRRMLAEWPAQLAPGRGPSGLAVSAGRPVVSADFPRDPRFREWAAMPMREGWRSVAAFPLIADDTILGTLVLYRTQPVPWTDDELALLAFVADHAAVAVQTAQLIDEQQRQVAALERVVRGLREQAHEHANRLHAIAGLLALEEPDEALAFIEHVTCMSVVDRKALAGLAHTVLAALIAVESAVARQRSIALEAEVTGRLDETALTDAQAVTIVGNLLDNAFEAVTDMPHERRRVRLAIERERHGVSILVRDWGPGLGGLEDPFTRGVTSKPGHAGVGLALVREAVVAAYGDIRAESLADGTEVVVALPHVEPEGRRAGDEGLWIMRGVDRLRQSRSDSS